MMWFVLVVAAGSLVLAGAGSRTFSASVQQSFLLNARPALVARRDRHEDGDCLSASSGRRDRAWFTTDVFARAVREAIVLADAAPTIQISQ